MIETIKDDEGRVVSYIEWVLVDSNGAFSDVGEYVFVRELWNHKSVRFKGLIRHYIQTIIEKAPTAIYGYWERKKYNCRMKMFSKEQLNNKE